MQELQLAILGSRAITKVDPKTNEEYILHVVHFKRGKGRLTAFTRSQPPKSGGAFITLYDAGEQIPWGKRGEKFKQETANIEFFTSSEALTEADEFDSLVADLFGDDANAE